MSDSSILSLILSMGLGGTAVFYVISGAILVALVFFFLLIISEVIFTSKENVTNS